MAAVAGCCGCIIFLPWLVLVCLSLYSLANQPSFCNDSVSRYKAAAEARPQVYTEDGSISWDSVSSGWNVACGDIPTNFTSLAESYSAETGGLQLLTDDSGFKSNAWSSGMFKVLKVRDVAGVDGFPFGTRPETFITAVKTFDVSVFWLPTAAKEVTGWMIFEYEICAYFQNPDRSMPNIRLYKNTEGPLGTTEPFVMVFVESSGDPALFKYDAVLEGYNDNPPGVGKARFSSLVTSGCAVWSTAPGNYNVLVLIIVLTLMLVLYIGAMVGLKKKAKGSFKRA